MRHQPKHEPCLYGWFQFTHPVWGATLSPQLAIKTSDVSIHAPRVGCDSNSALAREEAVKFQFTHPVWGATMLRRDLISNGTVSIHAPRVGCDQTIVGAMLEKDSFNSRTPCGVRPERTWTDEIERWFQFTHPVWGATPELEGFYKQDMFQFTHPVWGATVRYFLCHEYGDVSIHAPRVGCDRIPATGQVTEPPFQFTHPVWGATYWHMSRDISKEFQFTHPVWGATK